jgi:hypothetical protein
MTKNLTGFQNLSGLLDQIIDFQIITPTRATTRVAPTEWFVGATLVVAPLNYFSATSIFI